MSDYMFGLHKGHLTEEASRIARRHGAYHFNYTEPGSGEKRGWFSCPNLGAPFDQAVEKAVLADIEKAGGFEALEEVETEDAETMDRETEVVRLQSLIQEYGIHATTVQDAGPAGILVSWNGDDEFFQSYEEARTEIERVAGRL